MKDENKPKEQVIKELTRLRKQVDELKEIENRHMQIEDALEKGEKEKKAILDSISELVVYQDTDHKILWCNKAACESVNMAHEQLVGRHCYEIWPQRSEPCLGCPVKKALETNQVQENEISTPDGRIWVIRGYPVRDENGHITAIVETTVEITSRKKAEEGLKKSEERFRSLFLGIPLPSYIWKRTGQDFVLVGFNDAGMSKTKGTIVDYVGKKASEMYKDRPEIIEGFSLCVTEKRLIKREMPYWFESLGENRHLIAWYAFVPPDVVLVCTDDITDRVLMEDALRRSEARFRDITYSISDWIWEVDGDGVYTYCSDTLKNVLGYSCEEIIGKTPFDLMPRDEAGRIERIFSKMARNKMPIKDLENWNIHKNGQLVCLLTNGIPMLDDQGNLKGYRGVDKDITEKRRMEEEILKIQKLESIGLLAGGIAHNFNNILTAILGNISFAKACSKPGDKIFEALEEAEKASLRARNLTSRLITYSKGGDPIKKRRSIVELLNDSVDLALGGANVKCEFSLPSDLWQVEIDEGQFTQVINNIVINAVQAMPKGGVIKLKARNIDDESEDNLPFIEKRHIKISIEDKGHGISKELRPKIFDPFFTTKQMASGLGLYTSYSIIKKHNGHITVESVPGSGATFHVYLPACEEVIQGVKNREGMPFLRKRKILIMDDEETVRTIAGRMLEQLGYEIELVEEGEQAIDLYKVAKEMGKPFDVVILDLTIPCGLGGRETIKTLLEIDPEVKAIISSGYTNDPVVTNFWEYGFKGVVAKPYKLEELSEALEAMNSIIKTTDFF